MRETRRHGDTKARLYCRATARILRQVRQDARSAKKGKKQILLLGALGILAILAQDFDRIPRRRTGVELPSVSPCLRGDLFRPDEDFGDAAAGLAGVGEEDAELGRFGGFEADLVELAAGGAERVFFLAGGVAPFRSRPELDGVV